ncbi:DNA-binding CsgD family transcriptional regulator [Bradyrhizobium sp. GM24.11]
MPLICCRIVIGVRSPRLRDLVIPIRSRQLLSTSFPHNRHLGHFSRRYAPITLSIIFDTKSWAKFDLRLRPRHVSPGTRSHEPSRIEDDGSTSSQGHDAQMHRVFQNFIDLLSTAEDSQDFSKAMTHVADSLDLSCFAYLAFRRAKEEPRLISTYPSQWTTHYLRNSYQAIDPVIAQVLKTFEPFRWGAEVRSPCNSTEQRRLLDEAAQFGVRFGFTVPIHDGHGPVAALTFATDERRPRFEKRIDAHERVLQLMAMYFHAHVRRKLADNREIDGIRLSPRELECLEWASQGKSAWEIGCILGISRNTVAYYLDNAKQKLGVRTGRASGDAPGRCEQREAKLGHAPPATTGDATDQ